MGQKLDIISFDFLDLFYLKTAYTDWISINLFLDDCL